jgi:hypothetical protein
MDGVLFGIMLNLTEIAGSCNWLNSSCVYGNRDLLPPMVLSVMFNSSQDACNFILSWDGRSSAELLAAIRHARQDGDRFQQDFILRRVAKMPFEFPRPKDIPIFVGSPVWVVDEQGNALVGMPGMECVVHVDDLRKKIAANEVEAGLFRNDTHLL